MTPIVEPLSFFERNEAKMATLYMTEPNTSALKKNTHVRSLERDEKKMKEYKFTLNGNQQYRKCRQSLPFHEQ